MMVQDKFTGEWYDPQVVFNEWFNRADTVAMFKRMQNEEGRGWPKKEK